MIRNQRKAGSREVISRARSTCGDKGALGNLNLRTVTFHSFKKYFPNPSICRYLIPLK